MAIGTSVLEVNILRRLRSSCGSLSTWGTGLCLSCLSYPIAPHLCLAGSTSVPQRPCLLPGNILLLPSTLLHRCLALPLMLLQILPMCPIKRVLTGAGRGLRLGTQTALIQGPSLVSRTHIRQFTTESWRIQNWWLPRRQQSHAHTHSQTKESTSPLHYVGAEPATISNLST